MKLLNSVPLGKDGECQVRSGEYKRIILSLVEEVVENGT
jgi:hypothetical protein